MAAISAAGGGDTPPVTGDGQRRYRVQLVPLDDVEDLVGEEVVERTAVDEPGPQIGARHLEAGHLDAHPGDLGRQHEVHAGAVDHDEVERSTTSSPALPGQHPGRRVVTDDGEQLDVGLALGRNAASVSAV